jgi:poly(A) polymerase
MEHGPLDPADAEARLLAWWAEQPESAPQSESTPEAAGDGNSPAGVEISPTEESK